ncbi:MAG: hypothetical protein EBU06_06150 [Micrococcales bacterium]|nr:hypothetical protein [Micrococcales bacterium]NBR61206.1 hypothetical protein [Actinomycetota bacterium]NBS61329.1 hypothetical protein [Microbacteriaceae bacterium]NBT48538.1 hypothetical protein [Actinomycetota bacterium]NBY43687.1 hypothetical protein [Micrococcales bacterium]
MAQKRIIGFLLITIAALCSASCSSPQTSPSSKLSPSVTTTPSPSDTFDSEIRLAKNEVEEEFLQAALASCELTKTKSLGLYDSDGTGSHVTYFRPANTADLLLPENQITEDSTGATLPNVYYNYLPSLFDPCELERQAGLVSDPNPVLLEHKVVKIDPLCFAWSQHQGGANLETMYYYVTNGLITRYSRQAGSAIMTEVSYEEFTGDRAQYFVTAYGY